MISDGYKECDVASGMCIEYSVPWYLGSLYSVQSILYEIL